VAARRLRRPRGLGFPFYLLERVPGVVLRRRLPAGVALPPPAARGLAVPLRRLAFGPTALPGTPSRAELADLYAAASGRDLARLPFYYAFGLFKIAVIAQQIYYRWRQGLTRDSRFAELLPAIRALGRQAARVAAAGSLTTP
jgi:aminoglycoside phosphotransferase (APT) family kinase protein